jgi:hypothetical protein
MLFILSFTETDVSLYSLYNFDLFSTKLVVIDFIVVYKF